MKIKQILSIIALCAFVASISSCNRGYGCPQNFDADCTVTKTEKSSSIKFIQE